MLEIRFFLCKNFDFLISENRSNFLISKNRFMISELQILDIKICFLISKNTLKISKLRPIERHAIVQILII